MIKGISEIRRLPRVGVIRLGIKAKSSKGTEYPKAVDHFVCPEEVQKVFGEHPKSLDIVFPLDDVDDIFPQFYKRYGKSAGLKCKGDGEVASFVNKDGEFEEIECLGKGCKHYEKKECKEVATLNFIIPKVKLDGIYQIHTSSFHSIVKLNSSLDYIRSMFGRISMLPFQLVLEETEIHPDKKMKKTAYTMRLAFNAGEIMKSIQKRDGLLGAAGLGEKTQAIAGPEPKKEVPKIDLPSSDENPTDDGFGGYGPDLGDQAPPIEEENIPPAKRVNKKAPPKKQDKKEEEDEVVLCDVCETALTDKEIKSSKDGFKEEGKFKYQFLCDVCQKGCGFIKK